MEQTKQAIIRAEEALRAATSGLGPLQTGRPEDRMNGLRNVITFGRSVTFIVQNLRSIVGKQRFDTWYEPHQATMKADPLMRFFVDARNILEKQGRLNVSSRLIMRSDFDDSVLDTLEQPPFKATSFFLADITGGSGWVLDLGEGVTEKYYISIPEHIAECEQIFHPLPDDFPEEWRDLSTGTICGIYLGKLHQFMDEVRKEFLNNSNDSKLDQEPA